MTQQFLLPSLPLEVVKGVWGHCKLPSRVWGRDPAETEFGAF